MRPWRPPRDDADEAILDEDDTQPNWDAHADRPERRQGTGNNGPMSANRRPRTRPPAWPGGAQPPGRAPARRPGGGPNLPARPPRQGPPPQSRGAGRPPGDRQRRGTWMRPDSGPPDED